MNNIAICTEVETSYIRSDDITIVWQNTYVYVDGERDELLQRNLVGWYHGEPDDKTTPYYARAPLTAYYGGYYHIISPVDDKN